MTMLILMAVVVAVVQLRTNVDELFAELVRQVRKKSGISPGGKKSLGSRKKGCMLY
jgi:hypothetical protein